MAKRRAKGDGALFQRGDGMWIGQVDLGIIGGKRVRPAVSSKDYATARRKLRDLLKKVETEGAIPTKSMTLGKWLPYWVSEVAPKRGVKPSSLKGYRSKIRTILIPELGHHRLDRLQPGHLRAAYKRAQETRSSTTVLQAHAILRKALTDAARDGLVSRNVATLVDPPRKAVKSDSPLTATEAVAAMDYAMRTDEDGKHVDRIGARWVAAFLTGGRQGECLGLELDRIWLDAVDEDGEPDPKLEISWELQRIDFVHHCGPMADDGTWPCGRVRGGSCPDRQLDFDAETFEHRQLDGGLCLIRPKSRKGWRVVPILAPLEAALRVRLALAEKEPNPHGLVFTRPDGRPIDPSDDNADWHDILGALDIADRRLHLARDTTATLLDAAGVDEHTIMEIMGHSSKVANRGYRHVSNASKRSALEKMRQRLELDS